MLVLLASEGGEPSAYRPGSETGPNCIVWFEFHMPGIESPQSVVRMFDVHSS